MLTRLTLVRAALAALALGGLASCRRPLGIARDAGGDAGAPSVGDGGRFDMWTGDDGGFDAATGDLSEDVADDLAADGDAPPDGAGDGPPAVCVPGVPALDVCGCACCDGIGVDRACYYPALGETRDAIPNPVPTPEQCAKSPCSSGERHVCCADPGAPPSPTLVFCATNTSVEDMQRFSFTKRDGDACTTIEIDNPSGHLPLVATPFGLGNANAFRGKCDGSSGRDAAVGGLGSVTARLLRPGDSGPHYDVHVSLFFDNLTGIADVSRIDVDDIAVAPLCPTGSCPVCGGACAFDGTYRYRMVGGNVPYVDTAILLPPASYQHSRVSLTSMLSASCAPPPPACGGPMIDVADLMVAFGDADVQDAFTRALGAGTEPFYGEDQRPVDGQAFEISRGAGGGFLIGAPCPAGSTPASCMEIPGGLSRLESLLVAFDQQQLADPSCASLRP